MHTYTGQYLRTNDSRPIGSKGGVCAGEGCGRRPMCKLIRLAFSTCGGYSVMVDYLAKDLGELRVEMEECYLLVEGAGELVIQEREIGHLWQSPSLITQEAFACCTLRYADRRRIMKCALEGRRGKHPAEGSFVIVCQARRTTWMSPRIEPMVMSRDDCCSQPSWMLSRVGKIAR